ncbi:methyltransferase domain-containing protein [Candidatus Riflebacteria bacterium]
MRNLNQRLKRKFRGKKVLHLGFLGDWPSYIEQDLKNWIFKDICTWGKDVKGLDINLPGIKKFAELGFKNIIHGNAEDFDLEEKFEVIYAGELIEHLDNVGLFLQTCKKHMHRDSILILTTPNPYAFNLLLKGIFTDPGRSIYDEHTALFHRKNLDLLLKRHELIGKKLDFFTPLAHYSRFAYLKTRILQLLGRLKSNWHSNYYLEVKKLR